MTSTGPPRGRIYAPDRMADHPPLAPLRELLARLAAAGLPHALGASGLLAALGLVDEVNDWDVTVAAPVAALESACAGLDYERFGNSGCHADHKLGFKLERVELIADFAFFAPGGIVRIPTALSGHWMGIPIGSPTAWAVAYALLGELEDSPRRRERANALFHWLPAASQETAVRDSLLAQPLPPVIAERVRAIGSAAGSGGAR